MLRDPGGRGAVALTRRVLEGLRPGDRRLFRVIERDELDHLGAAPGLPFALAAVPGVVFSEATIGPPLGPMEGAAHGYDPAEPEMRTGFVGAGAGLRQGVTVPHMALTEIAPLAAALLASTSARPMGFSSPACSTSDAGLWLVQVSREQGEEGEAADEE